MKILAIETSCDETSIAVVENGRELLSNITATQIDRHRLYGGVVPEIASRLHCENIVGVCEEALLQSQLTLNQIDAIAVTFAPGLIGALLVGVNFAKGIAISKNKPLIPVHHIKGHIAANYIPHSDLEPPYLALVVSGGHSNIIEVKGYTEFNVIGKTLDDAAGEAFDKVARAIGFPYPGGVHIDNAAQKGDCFKYKLPYPKTEGEFDFSFSGLKTAVINLLHNSRQKNEDVNIQDLAASFQHTVSDILSGKLIKAAKKYNYTILSICGGVAANSYLRKLLLKKATENNIKIYFPPPFLCGDNAAMIGSQAYFEYMNGNVSNSQLNAMATLKI